MGTDIASIGKESEMARQVVAGTVDNDKVWAAYKTAEKVAKLYEDAEVKVRQIRESQARYLVQLIEMDASENVFKNNKNRHNFFMLKRFVKIGRITTDRICEYIIAGDAMGTIVNAVTVEIDASRKMNDLNEIENSVEMYKIHGSFTVSQDRLLGTPERYKEAVCGRIRQRLLRLGAVCIGDGVYVDPSGAEKDEINKAINIRLVNIRNTILSVQELLRQQKDDFVLCGDELQAVFDFAVEYKEEG